jgi:ribosome maturation factor RimP
LEERESVFNNDDVLGKIRQIAEPILVSEGMELVDIEYRREPGGRVLRLIIDHEGGVTVDDCASVSREIDRNLDVEDLLPGPYNLEISSPGLNRPLKKESDFHRFTNRLIKVKTAFAIDAKKTFRGKLVSCRHGLVEIESDGSVVQIPLDHVVKANLEYEF